MTLVELMISMGIVATVASSVFGSFLFLTRSSLISASYVEMDGEARAGLEIFARDVRSADNVSNFTANGVRVHLPAVGTTPAQWVAYSYDSSTGEFYRNRGAGDERVLLRGVEVFSLKRFSLQQDSVTGRPLAATNDLETKQLQVQLRAVRVGAARATATNNVISARYILRNKVVSN
jgi:type II secretory pathway component PulJ